MTTVILHSSRGDSELRFDLGDSLEELAVSLSTGALRASAVVDAGNLASGGWHRTSTVLVTTPEQSLLDLCDHIDEHRDDRFSDEIWQSRGGQLELGFSHRDGEIAVAVTLRHTGAEPWVLSTTIDVSARDVGAMLHRLRSLVSPLPV